MWCAMHLLGQRADIHGVFNCRDSCEEAKAEFTLIRLKFLLMFQCALFGGSDLIGGHFFSN